MSAARFKVARAVVLLGGRSIMRSLHGALAVAGALLISLMSLGGAAMAFELKSSAFDPDGRIPKPYTCDGTDQSPPLSWSGAAQRTVSFALICEDPDAPVGNWVHWVLWNLPVSSKGLPAAIPPDPQGPDSSSQGTNDFRRPGYGGPCPPPGPAHRYFFNLYALDRLLDLKQGATKADLEHAMKGHVLARAQLIGRYGR
jgi:Raf kinase inhibitor-like YbhB/YbcL family protein